MQYNLHHDAVPWFSGLTRVGHCVAAGVGQVIVASHVSADPRHPCGGAEGARPAKLGHLGLTTQDLYTEAGPHHQSQQAFSDLLQRQYSIKLVIPYVVHGGLACGPGTTLMTPGLKIILPF